MVAQDFFDLVSRFNPATSIGVEDFSDRFNFLFTVIALMLCTAVVTVKQYLLRPISCYMSTSIGGFNLVNYVENYCWIHGTNPISIASELSIRERAWKKLESQKMDYYQWVPFVLGLQCIMFYLPRIFWQMVTYYRYGTDLQKLVAMSMEAITSQIKDTRDDLVRYVARTLEQMLFHYRDNRTSFCARLNRMGCVCTLSKRLGYWLVLSYVLMKLMYLANAIGQIYLMQRFLGLGTNYSYFGINIVHDIMSGRDWQKTMVFPRVTFCHVSLKSVGSNNHVVAQCVLPVNMLNEKIYVFLWFWVVLACILTAVSIPLWVLRLMRLKSNADFVRKYLELAEIFAKEDRPLVNKFVRHFLRQDGIFMLRMLSLNAGDLVTSEIVIELWNSFREKYKHRDFRNDGREGFSLRTIQPSAPEEECLKAT